MPAHLLLNFLPSSFFIQQRKCLYVSLVTQSIPRCGVCQVRELRIAEILDTNIRYEEVLGRALPYYYCHPVSSRIGQTETTGITHLPK